MDSLVGSEELAKRLGLSRQRVHDLANAGVLSCEKNAKGWLRFDPVVAVREYDAYKNASDDEGTDWNLERAKHDARIKRATADMKELERDEMLGKYHRAEFVEDLITELILAHRSAVMALPGKLAPILAGEDDPAVIAAKIKDEVRAMQEDLSRYEYDPGYFRERLAELQGREITDDGGS